MARAFQTLTQSDQKDWTGNHIAHHGYIPLACQYMQQVESPRVLEIGVDRGQTTIPLAFWLSHHKKRFHIDCIDINLDASLQVILTYTGLLNSEFMAFHVQNSLEFLEKLGEDVKYDVVFLDGDHNYYTVSRELELLKQHVHPATLIIIDDYHGRWADRDLFYAERDSHKEIKIATQPVETEKHGVRAAVDEFLDNNPQYTKAAPIQGEPVILYMKAA